MNGNNVGGSIRGGCIGRGKGNITGLSTFLADEKIKGNGT